MGNSKGQVKVFNVSTGKLIKVSSFIVQLHNYRLAVYSVSILTLQGSVSKIAGAVYCLTCEPSGSQIWAGDNKVCLYSNKPLYLHYAVTGLIFSIPFPGLHVSI